MKNQSGQSLIEVIFAMGMVVLILVTLVSGVTASLRNLQLARNKTLAAKYAQEGIEAVRMIRDTNWSVLTNGNHGLSWDDAQWSFVGENDTIDNQFTRSVEITDASLPETKTIGVTITWFESGATRTVDLQTVVAKLN